MKLIIFSEGERQYAFPKPAVEKPEYPEGIYTDTQLAAALRRYYQEFEGYNAALEKAKEHALPIVPPLGKEWDGREVEESMFEKQVQRKTYSGWETVLPTERPHLILGAETRLVLVPLQPTSKEQNSTPFGEALRLLRDLADLQNGPPLVRREKQWNETMDKIYTFLNQWEQPAPQPTQAQGKDWKEALDHEMKVWGDKSGNPVPFDLRQTVIDWIEQNLVDKPGSREEEAVALWISVSDKMPEDLEDVLGSHEESESVQIVYYSFEDKKWWSRDDNDGYERLITHWMPLPETPIRKTTPTEPE